MEATLIGRGAMFLRRRLGGKVNETVCLGPGLWAPVTALVTEVMWGRRRGEKDR